MKAVKFTAPATVGTLYNPGDVAGFDDDVADNLVAAKVAEPVEGKPEPKKAGGEK
ncbi:hypothetical protein ACW7BJ_33350 [Azospirillum argentinense]